MTSAAFELEPAAREICRRSGLEFVRAVGRGAFKETFEVKEGTTTHALKVYRPNDVDDRVAREINAALQCNHPNIAKLRRVDQFRLPSGTHIFLLEEFLGGGTLAERIQHTPLGISELLRLARQLVDALRHIAQHELVHRDIKPENVMLREDGTTPVIVDFGLVRALGLSSLTTTWLPQGPGTPYYAAPEQLNNDKHLIDWRTDQFSLGVLLACAAWQHHPYRHPGDISSDVVRRVAARGPRSVDFTSNARQSSLTVLEKMVKPWPVERYRTPAALASAWAQVQETR